MKHPDEGQTVEELTTLFVDMAAFLNAYRGGGLDLKMAEGGIASLLLVYLEAHADDQIAINSLRSVASQMLFESDLMDPLNLTTDLAMIIERRRLLEQKLDAENH
jgi:hypothetical protein